MANLARKIPIIGGFFDNSDAELQALIDARRAEIEGIQMPSYGGIELGDVRTIEEDPALAAMQRQALQRMAYLADQGFSAQDIAAYEQANQEAQLQQQRERQAIEERAARQGMSGSGMSMVMQQMANQATANQQRQAALGQASDAARQRALYNQAYLSGVGSLRGQEADVGARNAQMINDYNQRLADLEFRKRRTPYEDQMAKQGLLGGVFSAQYGGVQSAAERDARDRAALTDAAAGLAGAYFGAKKP